MAIRHGIRADAAKGEHRVEIIDEIAQPVVAALDHDLATTGIARHGDSVIEHFVAGGHQQQIA
ncbi:hypothetical protein D3C83_324010 [compost metagenome]